MRSDSPEYQRMMYAKHRDKRLAAVKAKREVNIEEARAYQRAQYAKHREQRVADAREYRRKNREAVNAKAAQNYEAKRETINERRKGYRQKHAAKIYARIQKWRQENPERELLYHAKRLLNEQTGVRIRDIPNDLAEAKVEQLKITRWVREEIAKAKEES